MIRRRWFWEAALALAGGLAALGMLATIGADAQIRYAAQRVDTTLLFYADNTHDIGATGATRPRSLFLADPALTVGAGTGVTINDSGEVRQLVYKVTVTSAQFVANGLTHDLTVATLPAKAILTHALADVTTTFACTAVCVTATLSMTAGSAAGGNQYLLSFDADAAAAQFGDAQAELGASLATATAPTPIGALGAWAGTTPVSLRLTSAVGNLGDGAATNLSQGSVTIYLVAIVLP